MNKVRRVVNNTLISLFGQLVTWTSTLMLTIAFGRFLGDTKFGELYFAITFVSLVGIPVEQGVNQQLTRDVAVDL
jgi:O-antigen/teichoic acid export membrane protein